jgi:hypothetical protein
MADQSVRAEALARLVSEFGVSVTIKLQTRAGHVEAQLRDPFARLLREAGRLMGVQVLTVDETPLDVLGVRPDFMVAVAGARVGYAELKAPGRKVPTTWSPDTRERRQWDKLRLLPNVLYTDGEQWGVYRFGELHGTVAELDGSLWTSGSRLRPADSSFERVVQDFLLWKPDPPRTIRQLVRAIANLCRLLRDEVSETLGRERSGGGLEPVFTDLVEDWRALLFPGLSDADFADAYAQTVTFGLLLARIDGISFEGTELAEIARQLGKKHSLMGKALDVLTERIGEHRSIVLTSLLRVVGAVDWDLLRDRDGDTYLHLYSYFLEEYDAKLRRRSGSYYTPGGVVAFMVRFVEEILRNRMQIDWGLASKDVRIIDPAMGTGTYLLSIIDTVARTVAREQGDGAVGPQLRGLFGRLIGFERQAGPYAVAQMRTHHALKSEYQTEIPEREVKLLVADTLDDPYDDLYTEQVHIPSSLEPIARSRREANRIKLKTPIHVVIGNPPYGEKAKGLGGWIETGSQGGGQPPPLDAFRAAGRGKFENVLSNLYVYFWRWATWKVFDAHEKHADGIVAFISPSSFTTGVGYSGMREYLRRTADEGWIIDLSPEKFRPEAATRIFTGVQHKLCIAVFARYGAGNRDAPAGLNYIAVTGDSENKYQQLASLSEQDAGWVQCGSGWQDLFIPATGLDWQQFPSLGDLMPWSLTGITPNRNWVHAPDKAILQQRWAQLILATPEEKPRLLKETDARKIDTILTPLPGTSGTQQSISSEASTTAKLERVALRSFDRQHVIYDVRVIDRPRAELWHVRSDRQVYVTEQHAHPIETGPGLVFAEFVPGVDHFNGRGGRVLPLYRDAATLNANLAPGLIATISHRLKINVTADDMLAYIAALVAHASYTSRFANELKNPGIRLPLTADPMLWVGAVQLGRKIIWLHTYGERFDDQAEGRPKGPPMLPTERRPRVVTTIPGGSEQMPEEISYDPATETLHVGVGEIRPVPQPVWEYEVSGMRIIRKWFDYRKRKPRRKRTSPLDDLNATEWSHVYTTELLELLNVLCFCVELEPQQATLLDRICAGPMITVAELESAKVLPVPSSAQGCPVPSGPDLLTLL